MVEECRGQPNLGGSEDLNLALSAEDLGGMAVSDLRGWEFSSWAPFRRATMASCIAFMCCPTVFQMRGHESEFLVRRETMASCIAFVVS
jgi:hypothetical protein